MAANQTALLAGIKLLVDAGKTVVTDLSAGGSFKLADIEAIFPDVVAAVEAGGVSDIVAEVKSLTASDIPALASVVASDLGLTNAHSEAIVNASIKVITDVASQGVPDTLALLAAIKAPQA
jgi:hypothetical protein